MAFALSHPGIDTSIRNREGHTPLEVSIHFRSALKRMASDKQGGSRCDTHGSSCRCYQQGDNARFGDFLFANWLAGLERAALTLHFSIMTTTADAFDAIEIGDLDAFTAALDAGTDPNETDGNGFTLLMQAIGHNQLHMVDVLLYRGANVHLKAHDGLTALHLASVGWRGDVFPAVFSTAGPHAMNFLDCYGYTPLHYLALYGSVEQIAFALSHPGIDTSTRDRVGRTPLEINGKFLPALQTYRDQEARWQPIRYTWIKLLMIPTRR